jgi:NADH:ubiquinone oxidoreductase subunit E
MRKKTETAATPEIDLAEVDRLVHENGGGDAHVIRILQAIQRRWRYLPQEALRRVCETTAITPARIAGVSTFYTQFRHRPVGRYMIRVCHGTACYVRGAERITEAIRKYLHIEEGDDTDPHRIFTVENVNCIGCCSLAPCMLIEDVTYGHLTPQNVHRACERFLKDFGE